MWRRLLALTYGRMRAFPQHQAVVPPSRAQPWAKLSFLKLPVGVDVPALLADYRSLPADAWQTSHWEIHCSSSMVLLRGGKSGTERDFTTRDVSNSPLLARMPYVSRLVSDDGPFGRPTYAFIFRMKPMGVARPHVDDDLAWKDPFRIHIPITTTDGSFLLADRRAKHFDVGEVWTFDNQGIHAVTNGDGVRAHLIIDVPPNPKLSALLAAAQFDPGLVDEARWARTQVQPQPTFTPVRSQALSVPEKLSLGLDPEGFASRITEVRWVGRLTRVNLRRGDVVFSVDGVEACEMARTATEYLHLRHQPGARVVLGIIRDGRRQETSLTLRRNFVPTPVRRALWRLGQALRAAR